MVAAPKFGAGGNWYGSSGGGVPDPDSLAGELVYLKQPFGETLSLEFSETQFVSRETPTEADQTLYLYFNNF